MTTIGAAVCLVACVAVICNAQTLVYSPRCLECRNSAQATVTEFDVYYETSPQDDQYCYAIQAYYKAFMTLQMLKSPGTPTKQPMA